jgi:outer membrane protein assembly factor BamB
VPQRVLKAIDVRTGTIKWKVVQPGPGDSWGGTLATAAGLVFYGDETGAFVAADSATGRDAVELSDEPRLACLADDVLVRRAPVIAVAAGPNIIAFALPDPVAETVPLALAITQNQGNGPPNVRGLTGQRPGSGLAAQFSRAAGCLRTSTFTLTWRELLKRTYKRGR